MSEDKNTLQVSEEENILDPIRGSIFAEESKSDQGIVDSIQSKIQELIDKSENYNVKEPLKGELNMPYEKDIIEEAILIMTKKKQEQYGKDKDLPEDKIKRLPVHKIDPNMKEITKNPNITLVQFGLALQSISDSIKSELDQRQESTIENPLKKFSGDPIMLRNIAQNIGPHENLTIIYGATKILFNIGDDLGFTNEQINFVRLCHNIAARRNGLHLYTITEDVLFIDNSLQERVNFSNMEDTKEKTEAEVTELSPEETEDNVTDEIENEQEPESELNTENNEKIVENEDEEKEDYGKKI